MTLSATGAAAEKWPEYLGRYETEAVGPKLNIYRNSKDKYLEIHRNDGLWHASTDGYKTGDSVYRSVGTSGCPVNIISISQWQYRDNDGSWHSGDIAVNCS